MIEIQSYLIYSHAIPLSTNCKRYSQPIRYDKIAEFKESGSSVDKRIVMWQI